MLIGCHTMQHPMLSTISLEAAAEDIQSSKDYLSKVSGQPIEYFAYPYGKYGIDFDEHHAELIKNLGFKAALSTDWGTLEKTSRPCKISRIPNTKIS